MTTVENTNATETPSSYEICARSGFRVKRGTLVKDGYGAWVKPEFAEGRHPQEFIRGKPERLEGARRPEPNDRFISDLYPNGVSASDL